MTVEEELIKENLRLRRMLAGALGGPCLYVDDGELSCAAEFPSIDFKRDTASEIQRKITARNMKRLSRFNSLDDAVKHFSALGKKWVKIYQSDRLDQTRPLYEELKHALSFTLRVKDTRNGDELYKRTVLIAVSDPSQQFRIGSSWVDISQKTAIALWASNELFADVSNKEREVPQQLETFRDTVDLNFIRVTFTFE